mmetsp:Transcript_19728/g.29058  ORF Transcript_19728/g.29058 Transcript_19728/m.29058 type:complete len:204 (-) Transcript_19728:182-793(-)|eukprot:CAMPEP_0195522184 /NCGR_PEP_ID=MMETSP0794_2-20130614/20092_1 /TAXON_ID=515487 /ORGANISM="Stephanopyxis turris, Strain CCMP 815" /LENGTH=203 /DNA_ID=CAMNT_0040651877 /DNA_START=29 /DNA_END=640 /DNA_ORIENTATION=-
MLSVKSLVKAVVILSQLSSALCFLPGWPGSKITRKQLKSDILDLSRATERGLTETPEQKENMYQMFETLEKLNPTKKPLASDLVNDIWSLEYTTSDSILGRGDFPRVGPILQKIDTTTLSAENSEVVSYFGLKVPRKVEATLSPKSDQFTDVKFDRFSIGPIGFSAPEKFRGALDITYVDEDIRLSRGDKGNIFVLTRFSKDL